MKKVKNLTEGGRGGLRAGHYDRSLKFFVFLETWTTLRRDGELVNKGE